MDFGLRLYRAGNISYSCIVYAISVLDGFVFVDLVYIDNKSIVLEGQCNVKIDLTKKTDQTMYILSLTKDTRKTCKTPMNFNIDYRFGTQLNIRRWLVQSRREKVEKGNIDV